MKTFAKIIIIIAVFFSGFYVGRYYALTPVGSLNSAPAQSENKDAVENKADLKIDFGNGDVNEFSGVAIKENETVFYLLKKTTEKNNIGLKYKDYGGDMGVLVESIDGAANDYKANKYWQFWVNGEYSNIGASGYKLKNGDKVEWRCSQINAD